MKKKFLNNTLLMRECAHWVLAERIYIMMQVEMAALRKAFGKE